MKPKLNSAYLCVKVLKRAVNFYNYFLDIKPIKKSDSLFMYEIDGFRLFLFDYQSENEEVIFGDNCLLSFEVESAIKYHDKIKQKGYEIIFPIQKILNNYIFEFEDSEGNHIEVYSKI